jgi:transposase-like protein
MYLSLSRQNAGQWLNTSHDDIITDPAWLVMDSKQEDHDATYTDSTKHKLNTKLQKQIT